MSNIADRYAHLSPLKRALLAVETMQAKLDAAERAKSEPIAITGMGCRFPGGVIDPDSFWRLLRDGAHAITEVPADRWDIEALYDPDPDAPGKMSTRWGGFIKDIDQFDPQFFGIAPREASGMDPQQRLLLEVCWEALERAGQATGQLAGSPTGVFIGVISSDYGQLWARSADPSRIDGYFGTGTALSILAGRLSYVLGLQGPSMSVDTACSSSLVTVHLACQSLRARECDLALAGGVNLVLTPEGTIYFSRVRAMAGDGRCKAFDARADGFVRSDGCGVVVLKRLSDALAAGDPILAVIRGSAVNQDGRSGGLTAPNGPAQQAVIRAALANAKVEPARVQYVEAHGTGTALGDPMEVQALGAVMRVGRPPDQPLAIGSVKTNMGHTEAAAGVAGLMKVVLALQHREIPPHLHFEQPSPHIAWNDLPVVVPATRTPWPATAGPRIAGVSSFGFSGTNAHLIVEEAPPGNNRAEIESGPASLLPLSARSPGALRELARRYQQALMSGDALHDVCYTAGVRRSHHEHRLTVVGETPEDLSEHLAAFLRGESSVAVSAGTSIPGQQRRLVFVFPGQGGQWRGMARDLLATEPVFRASIEECAQAMAPLVSWPLLDLLRAGESGWEQIDVVQPALFALQVALAALWRSWGIEPRAVVGHSMGEVAAACVAGALRLEDAARIICRRSALLKRVRGQGSMAVAELSMAETESAVAKYAEHLSIAASNSPRSTVLSGEPRALETVLQILEGRGVFCRRVNVDVASHSPQMDALRDDLLQALAGVQPQAATLPFYSTVTGKICDGPELDSMYWVRNLREPVRFWGTLERLLQEGFDLFVELSPHPTLAPAIQDGIRHARKDAAVLPSLRRDEPAHPVLLGSLGALYCQGYPVDWRRRYPAGGRTVSLPTYPWQRERFWLEAAAPKRRPRAGHPLLGEHRELAAPPGTHCWQTDVGIETLPFLSEHRVLGRVVLPAAGYLEMALTAAAEAFGSGARTLEHIAFKEALFLPDEGSQTVQTITTVEMTGRAAFQISSRSGPTWTTHATGAIRLGEAISPIVPGTLDRLRAQCSEAIDPADIYHNLQARGLEYGPSFRGASQVWRGDGEAIARLRLPESETRHAFGVHPVLLDAAFQLLAAALPQAEDHAAYVPVYLSHLRMFAKPPSEVWAYARLSKELEADFWLLSESGEGLLEATGLRVQRLDREEEAESNQLNDWLYDIEWQQLPSYSPPESGGEFPSLDHSVAGQRGCWLLFSDRHGIGAALGDRMEAAGETCIRVAPGPRYLMEAPGRYQLDPARPEEFRRLLREALGAQPIPCRGVLHLWSLSSPSSPSGLDAGTALAEQQTLGCVSVFHLVQALAQAGWRDAPRLWLVTAGAQAVEPSADVSVAQAPLWGLGRAIAHEHSELRSTCVDLSRAPALAEVEALAREVRLDGREDQIALRGELRYGARLRRCQLPEVAKAAVNRVPAGGRSFALEIDTPGILDHLTLRAAERRVPGPGEVEIQVYSAALNFLDVLSAMGLRPNTTAAEPVRLGGECAGAISALGEGVAGLSVGDAVVALAPGAFRSFVTVPATFVVRKPGHLSFEEAASIPIAFMTASYALEHLSRLAAGGRVLIHSATGGVGLAAVQLAQVAGAEIFATAGSEEKREFLRSIGIRHVMDSRTPAFVEEILAATEGRGVDVVLNSLTGEAIPRSLSVLAPFGRFVEIGKRDIYENKQIGLAPFRKNLSYFAVDLARMIDERPAGIRSLLCDVLERADAGVLKPLPIQVYPIGEAVNAFRDMAQATHIGKITMTLRHPDALIIAAAEPQPGIQGIHADGSYLITGGLGGLGLAVAQWLVTHGARHLVLAGRGGASHAAQEAVASMVRTGAEVRIMQADVSKEEQVVRLLAEIEAGMPRLCGIVHAAGVLDDGLLLQLDEHRLRKVMAPKIQGAWNLHAQTLGKPLDFFVLFSSVAAWLGSPGQSNYAAANAFLDALAQHRRAQGLPALSMNWGPWSDVGLAAAEANRGARLAFRGIVSLTPRQGVDAFGQLLGHDGAQIGIMALNLRQWRQFYPKIAGMPLVANLIQEEDRVGVPRASVSSFREALLAAVPSRRASILETHVKEHLAQVLRLAPSRIDTRMPLRSLGIDSLMALELRNRLEAALALTLSATLVWNYPTITSLVPYLAERLGIGLETAAETTASAPELSATPSAEAEAAELDQLSESEMAELLARELDALAQRKST